MALYYLDTSAAVKLYIQERGTERLLELANQNHRFIVLSLAQVELHSAVRRRKRLGDLDGPSANELLKSFAHHMETKFLRQSLNEVVLETAIALIDRYPLRAYDAMQLAGCLVLRVSMGPEVPVFVSADQNQLDAAQAEGLETLNPCS